VDVGEPAHRRGGDEPVRLFRFRYYGKWLGGITQFFIDRGYLTPDELASRQDELAAEKTPEVDPVPAIDEQVVAYLRKGDSPRRDGAHPKFAVGDRVRITNVPAASPRSRR
jgi:nitrile hydratase subunit beta